MADIKQINVGGTTYNIEPYTSYLPLAGGTMSGMITLPVNTKGIKFRKHDSYEVGTYYGTSGNEALTFYAQNAVTSFQFICGEIPTAGDSWKNITPGLQIKNNKVIINKKLGDNESSSFNLEVNGTTYVTGQIRTDAPLFAYAYANGNNNRAAVVWDKPGANYTGVGACAEADTIFFGACSTEGVWVTDYKQKWKFNGTIYENGTSLTDKYAKKADMSFSNGVLTLNI